MTLAILVLIDLLVLGREHVKSHTLLSYPSSLHFKHSEVYILVAIKAILVVALSPTTHLFRLKRLKLYAL